jgi:hypothetical protein
MSYFLSTLTIISFIASMHLSTACFSIVRRMSKLTPWSVALAITALAALGAYTLVESASAIYSWASGYYSPATFHVSPLAALLTLLVTIILDSIPRLNV